MFPWIWLWAPQLHLPFSGDVAQDIEPRLDAFFAGIKPQAGNARIEARAFEVASYGDQLGVITRLLIELAERQPAEVQAASLPLQELRCIQDRIEAIKDEECERELTELQARVRRLESRLTHGPGRKRPSAGGKPPGEGQIHPGAVEETNGHRSVAMLRCSIPESRQVCMTSP